MTRKRIGTYRHDPIVCRVCGAPNSAARALSKGSRPPSNNSFSLCLHCGEVSLFVVEDGKVVGMREPNFVELAQFASEHGAVARAAQNVRARRAAGGQPSSSE